MITDVNDRNKERRTKAIKALNAFKNSDSTKIYIEYLHLCLDQKVNLLLLSSGEEAIALRGEIRCVKHLLSVFEQGDAPFTDSI